jgi:hypothetical protein
MRRGGAPRGGMSQITTIPRPESRHPPLHSCQNRMKPMRFTFAESGVLVVDIAECNEEKADSETPEDDGTRS